MKPALPLNVEYQRFRTATGGFWKVVDANGNTVAIVDPGGDFDGAGHLAGVIKAAIVDDLSTDRPSTVKSIPSQPMIPGLFPHVDHNDEAACGWPVLQDGALGLGRSAIDEPV